MKFDNAVQKAILRLKDPDNQRVTGNLREAVELVATYIAELAQGPEQLVGGYKSCILQSDLGGKAFLVKGSGFSRVAFIALPRPLWDAEGAVQIANTEQIKMFIKEVSQGLVEAIGVQLGKIYSEKLREVGRLLGKGMEPEQLRRTTDWSEASDHA